MSEELALLDELIASTENGISYCASVGGLASAISLNKRRLLLVSIRRQIEGSIPISKLREECESFYEWPTGSSRRVLEELFLKLTGQPLRKETP